MAMTRLNFVFIFFSFSSCSSLPGLILRAYLALMVIRGNGNQKGSKILKY
jgi:hypothetical protein